MIVNVKQLVHKPPAVDKDGIEVSPAYATLTVMIEKTSDAQREAINDLGELVSTEECLMVIEPRQGRMSFDE